jgi:hypothetical protein
MFNAPLRPLDHIIHLHALSIRTYLSLFVGLPAFALLLFMRLRMNKAIGRLSVHIITYNTYITYILPHVPP